MTDNKIFGRFPDLKQKDVVVFTLLFIFVALLHGAPVPSANETVYLLQLEKQSQADFLINDWTFQHAGDEHWLFNRIFGFLAIFVSIEIIGWAGRIATWSILLFLLLRLGEFWKIPGWQTGAAIFLWLAYWQAAVGGEWMIGTFEAKPIAYIFLLLALIGFCRSAEKLSAAFLGLTFCFHPAVGLWGILAAGLALLFNKTPLRKLAKVVLITALFVFIGVLPLLGSEMQQSAAAEDWRFIVEKQAAHIFNPLVFPLHKVILLYLMLFFNAFVTFRTDDRSLRFFLYFQIAICLIFTLGVGFRLAERFELLRLMPFRLFPLFTPLFFTLTAFFCFSQLKSRNLRLTVGALAAIAIIGLNPLSRTVQNIADNYDGWTYQPTDLHNSYLWLAANTPPDAVTILPPVQTKSWYVSRRAQIATLYYPVYERLGEWRERINDLTDNVQISRGEKAVDEIGAAFNNLSESQINVLKAKYRASYLVSRAEYSYPIVFSTKTYKIYRLE